MTLIPIEREYFHYGVAARMVSTSSSNQITSEQFRSLIANLYHSAPEAMYRRQSATETAQTRPLAVRMKDREKALEEVETDVRAYGILVNDYSRMNTLRFAHKSFFEFTFAKFVSKILDGEDPEEVGAIRFATGVGAESIIQIPNSLSFLGELLSQTGQIRTSVQEGLQNLLDGILFSTKYRWFKVWRKVILLEILPTHGVRNHLTRPSQMLLVIGLA